MKFSPSQAHYALNVLMSQGKLRVAHIRKALKNREQEIRSLRERLAALEQFSPGASAARGPRRPGRPARGREEAHPAHPHVAPGARAAETPGEIHGLCPAVEAGGESARARDT